MNLFSFPRQKSACPLDVSASLPAGAQRPNDLFCWVLDCICPLGIILFLRTFLFSSLLLFHSFPRDTVHKMAEAIFKFSNSFKHGALRFHFIFGPA